MRGLQSDLQVSGFVTEALLAPEQALTLFFSRAQLRPRQAETVPFEASAGRILAEPVRADRDYPQVPRSAMDGFALRSQDAPAELAIAGEIHMGSAWTAELAPGSALRIPTGGVLPPGADCVVPVEETAVAGERVTIPAGVSAGSNIIPAGSDMRAGELVLEEGRRIGAAEIGVLAAIGMADVRVYRVPLFGIVSSGDELVDVRSQPGAAQVRDSNRWAIAAKLERIGAAVNHYSIAPDDEMAYGALLRAAISECDGVVLSGGSSVGLRDLTPRLVEACGPPGVIVHGIKVKPGKPTLLASAGGKPVIGLPGNPTSALMILEAVAAPVIAQCVGTRIVPDTVEARLTAPVRKRAGWTHYVPVRLEETAGVCAALPLEMHSAAVSLLARASGFITLGETLESAAAGDPVLATRFL